MKIKWWQKLLSYIKPINIVQTSSDYNDYLELNLVNGRYQLCTEEAIYSYADKYDNFKLAFQQIRTEYLNFENILMLGFGLGSVPFMLEKLFKKHFRMVGIEIDDEIIYLASKYVIPDLKSEINMIRADAYSFVYQCSEKFDLIIVDVFQSDVIPEVFENEDFLEQLSEILSPTGYILYNRLAFNEEDKATSKQFFNDHFLKIFPGATILPTRGNYILSDKDVFIKAM